MKDLVMVAILAFSSIVAAAVPHKNFTTPDRNFTLHGVTKPWANDTHVINRLTGKPMKHFVNWSNGTHFTDPATNRTVKHFDCDVGQSTASGHFMATIKKLHKDHKRSAIGSRAAKSLVDRSRVTRPFQVPVYIHVITGTTDAAGFTQQMANSQIGALNEAYNPYGIAFSLSGTTFTQNDDWAVGDGTSMDDAKKALRTGTYGSLNLYFHSQLSGGALGTCTLPSQVQAGMPQSMYYTDGCNINANTMPGGTMTGYNLGKTAVHETGHWLGLLHTFEGYSCSGDGDLIADTPAESASTNGCPINPWKKSCPDTEGDPVHNYMDYSTDACYSTFTDDQVQRIAVLWTQYRAGM